MNIVLELQDADGPQHTTASYTHVPVHCAQI